MTGLYISIAAVVVIFVVQAGLYFWAKRKKQN